MFNTEPEYEMSKPTRRHSAPRQASPAVEIKRSLIDGFGLFACAAIRPRRKLGELTGELISQREANARTLNRKRIAMVELGNGRALDATVGGNAFRYTNHSCSPNAFIRIFGEHVEFYALRAIRPGDEITCNYGETQHGGTLPCRCGNQRCRKYL
jgi:uncharacterized protein